VDAGGGTYQRIYHVDQFPTTPPAISDEMPRGDVFVAKFSPSPSGAADLVYSTYLGGRASETGGIALTERSLSDGYTRR